MKGLSTLWAPSRWINWVGRLPTSTSLAIGLGVLVLTQVFVVLGLSADQDAWAHQLPVVAGLLPASLPALLAVVIPFSVLYLFCRPALSYGCLRAFHAQGRYLDTYKSIAVAGSPGALGVPFTALAAAFFSLRHAHPAFSVLWPLWAALALGFAAAAWYLQARSVMALHRVGPAAAILSLYVLPFALLLAAEILALLALAFFAPHLFLKLAEKAH